EFRRVLFRSASRGAAPVRTDQPATGHAAPAELPLGTAPGTTGATARVDRAVLHVPGRRGRPHGPRVAPARAPGDRSGHAASGAYRCAHPRRAGRLSGGAPGMAGAAAAAARPSGGTDDL